MNLENYKAIFDLYSTEASILKQQCNSYNEYEFKLSEICRDATIFYTKNSEYGERDYQSKIDVFLEFNQYIKFLKKNFIPPSERKSHSSVFFKQCVEQDSLVALDEELIDLRALTQKTG